MNDRSVRRARKLSVAGAILLGLAVSACSPAPAPAPSTTAPSPSTGAVTATQSAPPPSLPTAPTTNPATVAPATKPATVAPAAGKAAPAHPQVPTLGVVWGPYQHGYGTVRPAVVDNGGDPSGTITDVHWRTWGGKTAIGSGTASFVRDGEVEAQAIPRKATIEAWDLGTCHGKLVYRAVDWYFAQDGQKRNEHGHYNICTGETVDR